MAEHKMVNLKRAPKEHSPSATPEEFGQDHFPISLHLSTEEVEKLGLSDAQVGQKHRLNANVKVTSVSANERGGGKKHRTVELAFEEGEVIAPERSQKDQAGILFGGK